MTVIDSHVGSFFRTSRNWCVQAKKKIAAFYRSLPLTDCFQFSLSKIPQATSGSPSPVNNEPLTEEFSKMTENIRPLTEKPRMITEKLFKKTEKLAKKAERVSP